MQHIQIAIVEEGKHYYSTEHEKVEHFCRYPHIPSEIFEGISRQSTKSDIFAVSGILSKVLDFVLFREDTEKLATKCRSPQY